MKKSKIKIIRVYEGTRSAREILTEAIACKVRRKLDSDMEIIMRKTEHLSFFDEEAMILDIYLSYKCDHLVENAASVLYIHLSIYFFPTDDGTGMNAQVIQTKIGKFCIQFAYSRLDINTLIMEDHCNDIVRRM